MKLYQVRTWTRVIANMSAVRRFIFDEEYKGTGCSMAHSCSLALSYVYTVIEK